MSSHSHPALFRARACSYGGTRTGKDRTPAWIPDRFLQQYYLPPFRAGVAAGVATTMESYNDVNGDPVVGSEKYLRHLLRDDMGFTGACGTGERRRARAACAWVDVV